MFFLGCKYVNNHIWVMVSEKFENEQKLLNFEDEQEVFRMNSWNNCSPLFERLEPRMLLSSVVDNVDTGMLEDSVADAYIFSEQPEALQELPVEIEGSINVQSYSAVGGTVYSPDEDTVSYFSFDEIVGETIDDISAKANDGTVINQASATLGRKGQGMYFDGVNDAIYAPDNSDFDLTSGVTLSLWIKPASDLTKGISSDVVFAGKLESYWFQYISSSGVLEFISVIVGTYSSVYNTTELLAGDANRDGLVSAGDYASVQSHFGSTGYAGISGDANGDGVVSAGDYASVQTNYGAMGAIASPDNVDFSANTWYHIMGTYDGTTMRLYIDGQQVATKSISGSITTSAYRFAVGKFARETSDNPFNGTVDDVIVADEAKTPDELVGSPDDTTILHLDFEDITAGAAFDVEDIANNNDGEIIGSPHVSRGRNESTMVFDGVDAFAEALGTFVWFVEVDGADGYPGHEAGLVCPLLQKAGE